jgi:hypothetical protein
MVGFFHAAFIEEMLANALTGSVFRIAGLL